MTKREYKRIGIHWSLLIYDLSYCNETPEQRRRIEELDKLGFAGHWRRLYGADCCYAAFILCATRGRVRLPQLNAKGTI